MITRLLGSGVGSNKMQMFGCVGGLAVCLGPSGCLVVGSINSFELACMCWHVAITEVQGLLKGALVSFCQVAWRVMRYSAIK